MIYDEEVMGYLKASARLFEEFYRNFQKHFHAIGLKDTIRREALCKVLFFAQTYLNAEEIAHHIRTRYHVKISLPSIYKILHSLENINLVSVFLAYPSKTKKYKLTSMLHYDHLMCTKCGKIIQFHSEEIEQKQAQILSEHAFIGFSHTMVLYGICEECQNVVPTH